jgi:hypothetical protein
MIAHFLNRYFDSEFTYYDLRFIENDVNLLSLFGVIFEGEPQTSDIENRGTEIATINLPNYTITEFIIDS